MLYIVLAGSEQVSQPPVARGNGYPCTNCADLNLQFLHIMKKTLIALLALSGVASAETGTEFNAALAESITLNNYVSGSAFSVEFELYVKNHMDGNTGFVQFADNGWIANQAHSYFGINTSDSNSITEATGAYSKEIDGNNYTYTASAISPLWCQNPSLNGSESRGSVWSNDDNLSVTIATDGTDSWVTLSYGDTSPIVDTWKFTGVVLDATDIKLDDNLSVVSSNINLVPEPATATLSLLALAGLAARRRRK